MELGSEREVLGAGGHGLLELDQRRRRAGLEVEEAARHQVGEDPDRVDPLGVQAGAAQEVDDPAASLASIAGVLRPSGHLSLLVAQRHAAVVARAMAGHFQAARELLDDAPHRPAHGSTDGPAGPVGRSGRRFTHDEVVELLTGAGLTPGSVHAVRVFADLVPGSLLDLEPGATAALVELEQAVATRPEYLPLAAQLHVIARR